MGSRRTADRPTPNAAVGVTRAAGRSHRTRLGGPDVTTSHSDQVGGDPFVRPPGGAAPRCAWGSAARVPGAMPGGRPWAAQGGSGQRPTCRPRYPILPVGPPDRGVRCPTIRESARCGRSHGGMRQGCGRRGGSPTATDNNPGWGTRPSGPPPWRGYRPGRQRTRLWVTLAIVAVVVVGAGAAVVVPRPTTNHAAPTPTAVSPSSTMANWSAAQVLGAAQAAFASARSVQVHLRHEQGESPNSP